MRLDLANCRSTVRVFLRTRRPHHDEREDLMDGGGHSDSGHSGSGHDHHHGAPSAGDGGYSTDGRGSGTTDTREAIVGLLFVGTVIVVLLLLSIGIL